MPGLPLNIECRMLVTYSGNDAFRKEFTLKGEEVLYLGNIPIFPASKSLDEGIVMAERPTVTVRGKTSRLNAASFQTLPTSLLEDLLRKLPGVQVDRDGDITEILCSKKPAR